MQLITDYQNEFLSFLKEHIQKREPKNLYDPIEYILNVGGKRLRPVLTMLSTDIFDKDYHQALYAKENGLNLIDINHYESERYFSDFLAKYLQNLKIEVIISNSKNPFTYC